MWPTLTPVFSEPLAHSTTCTQEDKWKHNVCCLYIILSLHNSHMPHLGHRQCYSHTSAHCEASKHSSGFNTTMTTALGSRSMSSFSYFRSPSILNHCSPMQKIELFKRKSQSPVLSTDELSCSKILILGTTFTDIAEHHVICEPWSGAIFLSRFSTKLLRTYCSLVSRKHFFTSKSLCNSQKYASSLSLCLALFTGKDSFYIKIYSIVKKCLGHRAFSFKGPLHHCCLFSGRHKWRFSVDQQ